MERAWAGVPRQLMKAGSTRVRCACVKDYGAPSDLVAAEAGKGQSKGDLHYPYLREYEGCDPKEASCYIPKTSEKELDGGKS